ncbi:LamG domain-containing protein [Streptomyces sp. PmtA]|uniref:LamG domain-containing protein n=1 Tax=Streptomyces sp. PmtA TaxID=3074275 RepID=UPI0030148309
MAGTYNPSSGTLELYVNGKLQGVQTAPGSWAAAGPLQVGRYKWANVHQHSFQGSIDEVAVWQRALQPAEVAKEARALSGERP